MKLEVALVIMIPSLVSKKSMTLILVEHGSQWKLPTKKVEWKSCFETVSDLLLSYTGYLPVGHPRGWIYLTQSGVFDRTIDGERIVTLGYCCLVPEDTKLPVSDGKIVKLTDVLGKEMFADHQTIMQQVGARTGG